MAMVDVDVHAVYWANCNVFAGDQDRRQEKERRQLHVPLLISSLRRVSPVARHALWASAMFDDGHLFLNNLLSTS